MRVLVACEFSGTVRDAFIAKGHEAVSCDLLASDSPGPHIQGDVLDILDNGWDLMIAHPPCTYLSSSGLHWNNKVPFRMWYTYNAVAFVEALWAAPIEKVALENPVGCISTRSSLGKATQYIQPWWYGHDASKTTGLWLRNLEPLTKDEDKVLRRDRYANQTASGQSNLGPSPDRWKKRSMTYYGIAEAMANTWG